MTNVTSMTEVTGVTWMTGGKEKILGNIGEGGSPGGGREINDGFLCMACQTCIETYCCVAIQRVEEWER